MLLFLICCESYHGFIIESSIINPWSYVLMLEMSMLLGWQLSGLFSPDKNSFRRDVTIDKNILLSIQYELLKNIENRLAHRKFSSTNGESEISTSILRYLSIFCTLPLSVTLLNVKVLLNLKVFYELP